MRILFATDGSRGASVAEDFLLALPLSCADDVTVVTVPSGREGDADEAVAKVRQRLAGRHVPVTAILVRHGAPAEVLESVALERASQIIVIGSRGLGTLAGAILGSMARVLARTAPVPVLVVRSRREAPRHVLLAIDDSLDGRAAVETLATLPIPSTARITLVHVLAAASGEPAAGDIAQIARQKLGDRITDQAPRRPRAHRRRDPATRHRRGHRPDRARRARSNTGQRRVEHQRRGSRARERALRGARGQSAPERTDRRLRGTSPVARARPELLASRHACVGTARRRRGRSATRWHSMQRLAWGSASSLSTAIG